MAQGKLNEVFTAMVSSGSMTGVPVKHHLVGDLQPLVQDE